MPVYQDLLPATKSEPRGAGIDWIPSAADGPKAGVLTIKSKRAYCTYAVVEFPCGWDGRAFMFAKVGEGTGTDATEERYECYIAKNGQDNRCSCKGFERTGSCKHFLAVQNLIGAGQL